MSKELGARAGPPTLSAFSDERLIAGTSPSCVLDFSWPQDPSLTLEAIRGILATVRQTPHVVLEVRRYVPDGVAIDWTALQAKMAARRYALSPLSPPPANEQRYIISMGTLKDLLQDHPDWFGPFGVQVEYGRSTE